MDMNNLANLHSERYQSLCFTFLVLSFSLFLLVQTVKSIFCASIHSKRNLNKQKTFWCFIYICIAYVMYLDHLLCFSVLLNDNILLMCIQFLFCVQPAYSVRTRGLMGNFLKALANRIWRALRPKV
jgi:hypothetical protein